MKNFEANPPLNDSDWFRKDDDVRWQYRVPPRGKANLVWVQLIADRGAALALDNDYLVVNIFYQDDKRLHNIRAEVSQA